jgi:hypothetical protein
MSNSPNLGHLPRNGALPMLAAFFPQIVFCFRPWPKLHLKGVLTIHRRPNEFRNEALFRIWQKEKKYIRLFFMPIFISIFFKILT